MPPTKIVMVRHAEKQPEDPPGPPPYGVDEDGSANKHSLSVRGWQRAGALVPLFCDAPREGPIERPDFIYASAVDTSPSADNDGKSLRPQETVAPLALRLGLTVNTPYVVGQEAELAAEIESRSGIVLVAWEHKHIPLIAAALGAKTPSVWPDDRFDMLWMLTRRGDAYDLRQLDQSLLGGDARTS
jgi:hypothetical protein